ncbi:MAG: hypothetical protein HN548_01640 [Opitutae bacterium]|nr:hypothetical protein [Opitutae bacterium]
MKFFAVVFLIFVFSEFYFQCFAQVQNPSANLNPKEPDGNPSEFQKKFPKNTPPSRENNQSSSGNPKTGNPSPIQDEKKTGFGINILQSENSRLSSELSNKISELQRERESKHKLLTQFEKLQFEQEANQEVVDELRKIKLKNFSQKSENTELSNRNTHINGWYFIKDKGWHWTSPSVFPMIFSAASSNWLYAEIPSQNLQIFFNYQTQEWEKW